MKKTLMLAVFLSLFFGCNDQSGFGPIRKVFSISPESDSGELFEDAHETVENPVGLFGRVLGVWEGEETEEDGVEHVLRVLVQEDHSLVYSKRCHFLEDGEILFATVKVNGAVFEEKGARGGFLGTGTVRVLDIRATKTLGSGDRSCRVETQAGSFRVIKNPEGGFFWEDQQKNQISFEKIL